VSAFDFSHGRCFGWRILNNKVVEPVGDPGSVDLTAFGSVVNIPTILVLPVNKVAASFHLFSLSENFNIAMIIHRN
jgi:hypothetical protein